MTHYFALAIEPKNSIEGIRNALAKLITSWIKKINEINSNQVIYLPIDFSDQYTSRIKVEMNEDLELSYGYSKRERWSIDPINPTNFYESVTDFEAENKNLFTVKLPDFINSLNEQIEKLIAN